MAKLGYNLDSLTPKPKFYCFLIVNCSCFLLIFLVGKTLLVLKSQNLGTTRPSSPFTIPANTLYLGPMEGDNMGRLENPCLDHCISWGSAQWRTTKADEIWIWPQRLPQSHWPQEQKCQGEVLWLWWHHSGVLLPWCYCHPAITENTTHTISMQSNTCWENMVIVQEAVSRNHTHLRALTPTGKSGYCLDQLIRSLLDTSALSDGSNRIQTMGSWISHAATSLT